MFLSRNGDLNLQASNSKKLKPSEDAGIAITYNVLAILLPFT